MRPLRGGWVLAGCLVLTGWAGSVWAAYDDLAKVRMEAAVPDTGPAAREEAIRQAQIEIVADILKSGLTSEHFAIVKPLLDRTSQYIRTTQLLRCDTRDGMVHVEIECYVKRSDVLKEAAAMLLPRLPVPPTALIVVVYKTADGVASPNARDVVSKKIASTLTDGGFEIVGLDVVHQCHSDEEIDAAVQGDNEVAARFARERFADVVVMGQAEIGNAAESGSVNLVTSTARLTVRVFRAADGKLIENLAGEATVHGSELNAGIDATLQDACSRIIENLEVAAAMAAGGTHSSTDVVITIENPGGEARVREVMKTASAFAGEEAELLVCTEQLARVRIAYDGAMTPFLDALTQSSYSGVALETRKAIQRNVEMRFQP